jgi:hypothetical protein
MGPAADWRVQILGSSSSAVARIKRSAIRESSCAASPDFATLNPGYIREKRGRCRLFNADYKIKVDTDPLFFSQH